MLGGWPGIGSSASLSMSTRARLFIRPIVYGCRGRVEDLKTSESSTTRPAYITTTRSASSAISAEVVGDQDRSRRRVTLARLQHLERSAPGSSRRAPSSARPRSGRSARWRSPWRSSRAGACRRRTRAGTGRRAARGSGCRPARAARSRGFARRRRSTSSCARAGLRDLGADLQTGFSDVIGSWKIIAMSPPRTSRSSFFDIVSRSRPLKIASPRRPVPAARDQVEHRHHGHALPGPGLADHAEDLSGEEVVVDTGDRLDDPVLGAELDRHVANRQDGLRHASSAGSGRARRAGRRR